MKTFRLQIIALIVCNASVLNLYAQKTAHSEFSAEIRTNFFYDFQLLQNNSYRVAQAAPVLSIERKNHNIFLGPEFAYFFQPKPVTNEIFKHNSFGINFGYRYYSKYLGKNTRIYGQFNYSIFKVKLREYSLGNPYGTDVDRIIAENTITAGIDYRISKKIKLFLGAGFGSFNGFFLMVDKFTLSTNAGIDYKIL